MALKIYTKTGDKGKTGLIGGTKVSKADLRIEAYGTVDELNAQLGLCRDLLRDAASKKTLLEIQQLLFVIGAVLATSPGKPVKMQLPEIRESDCSHLEQVIDQIEAVLTPMKFFILPGGHPAVSTLHIARCVCRRAERTCVRLAEQSEVAPLILKYLNRLSDYLFVLTRFTAQLLQVEEIPWKPDLRK
ncbi:cob(I)yrinic acid a,c-diamide adenosyltransferase [Niabella terrae]